jgi:hypothetical protein
MKKENLVILKGKSTLISKCGTRIEPNKHYRCIEISEGKRKEFLVYGIVFDETTFNELFIDLHTVIMNEFKTLGLLGANNEPMSKSLFKNQASVHQYGKGKSMLNVLYFYGNSKECIYGFYPQFRGDSKAKCLENAYQMYLDLLNGDMDDFDCNDIQRGNCGIPIGFSDLRMREEFIPRDEKLELFI